MFVQCAFLAVAILTLPANSDKFDILISKIYDIKNNMGKLTGVVVDMKEQMDGFAKTEEITNEKVSKIEDRVAELVEEGKEAKTQRIATKKLVDEVKAQEIATKKLVDEVKTLVQKTDVDVISHSWKYYGKGINTHIDTHIDKSGATFPECVQWCEVKRKTDGYAWDGMIYRHSDGNCQCIKGDRGHDSSWSSYVHFQVQ